MHLTSTPRNAYTATVKRIRTEVIPTSDITVQTVVADGFTLSQTDHAGITKIHSYEPDRGLLLGTTYSDGTTARAYQYNHLGQLTQVTDDAGTRSIGYNSYGEQETDSLLANGVTHLITETRDSYGRSAGYTYSKNGVVQQTVTTGYGAETQIAYTYDHMGHRATKQVTENGSITLHQRYLYRGYLQVAACDLTRSGHPSLWLILWDPPQPIATRPLSIQKDGTWYCYGWNLTKNICEVYGNNGYVRTAYTYTPYGSATSDGDVTQPLQWSSEYADTELGLTYYNYRHYNPLFGRWISRDLIPELIVGFILYKYVDNNVIENIDLLGLFFSQNRTIDNCSSCMDYVQRKSKEYRNYIKMINEKGCEVAFKCVQSVTYHGEEINARGYTSINEKTKKITITFVCCYIPGQKESTINTFAHELTHAYDHCNKNKLKTCDDYICSEIKAYNVASECATLTGESRKQCIKIRVKRLTKAKCENDKKAHHM